MSRWSLLCRDVVCPSVLPGAAAPRLTRALEPARLTRDGRLAAAMPDEGGYVTCCAGVRTRSGIPGRLVVWIDSFVDVAVYPALFVEYLRFWYPGMAPLERWLLAVLFIVVLTTLNVVGVPSDRTGGGGAVDPGVAADRRARRRRAATAVQCAVAAARRRGAHGRRRDGRRPGGCDVELLGLGHAVNLPGRANAPEHASGARCS